MKCLRNSLIFAQVVVFAASLTSCEPEATMADAPATGYEACCGQLPLTIVGDGFRAYVPNAFSPDGDGVNDVFVPLVDEGVAGVGFDVFDRRGQLIYSTGRRYPRAELAAQAWDGTLADGSVYSGSFTYALDLYLTAGFPYFDTGDACALATCADGSKIATGASCAFADQQGSAGVYDGSRPSGDSGCVGD